MEKGGDRLMFIFLELVYDYFGKYRRSLGAGLRLFWFLILYFLLD